MVAKAGERAWRGGSFHCRNCDHSVYVRQGDRIPECQCGANEFDRRTDEPERQEPRHYGGGAA